MSTRKDEFLSIGVNSFDLLHAILALVLQTFLEQHNSLDTFLDQGKSCNLHRRWCTLYPGGLRHRRAGHVCSAAPLSTTCITGIFHSTHFGVVRHVANRKPDPVFPVRQNLPITEMQHEEEEYLYRTTSLYPVCGFSDISWVNYRGLNALLG